MKKNLIFIFLSALSVFCKAQITLEHTYDSTNTGFNFYITDIGDNNSKLVFIDTSSNSFSLYNLDGTPFLINIQTPDPIMPDFSIAYISNTLFDCDTTNIEYAFMSYLNQNKPFRIMRTDGTVLLNVDSARGPVCYGCVAGSKEIVPIINTQDGAKLLLFQLDGNSVRKTLIYGLCGKLPVQNSLFDFSMNNSAVSIYPNPAEMTITINVLPPNNIGNYDLNIFDSNGKLLKEWVINNGSSKNILDVSTLKGGIYYYYLKDSNKKFQSGKFTILK